MLLECQNCGGPLDAKQDARFVKCHYCGHSSRVASLRTMAQETPYGWKPPPVWTPPPEFPAQSVPIQYHTPNRAGLLIGVAVALVVLGGSLAALVAIPSSPGSTASPFEIPAPGTTPAASKSQAWDGKSTLTCAMGEELVIDNRQVSIDGTVIDAAISCKLRIKNSKLKGRTVIAGAMAARIEIENSTLEAEHFAVDTAQGSDVTIDKRSRITSKQTAIRLSQACKLRVKDSTIEAGEVAIEAGSASNVRVEGSTLSGNSAALDVDSPGDVHLDRTRVTGKRKIDKGVRVTER